jgi:hypothetical protein
VCLKPVQQLLPRHLSNTQDLELGILER